MSQVTTFTGVDKTKLQKAFAIAHHNSENPDVPAAQRTRFREIARLIWQAHGERGTQPPQGAGTELASKMGLKVEAARSMKAFVTPQEALVFAERNANGPFTCLIADNAQTPHISTIHQYRDGAWVFVFFSLEAAL